MNTIIGDGQMTIGGALRPFYIGTRQTAEFCQLRGEAFDLQDYNQLMGEILGNQLTAQTAAEQGAAFTPTGRKELTPAEVRDFVYSALVAGAGRQRQPVGFTPDDVADWIDEAPAKEVMKPIQKHIELLAQRIKQQQAYAGNAPAPALKASRGGKSKAKKA